MPRSPFGPYSTSRRSRAFAMENVEKTVVNCVQHIHGWIAETLSRSDRKTGYMQSDFCIAGGLAQTMQTSCMMSPRSEGDGASNAGVTVDANDDGGNATPVNKDGDDSMQVDDDGGNVSSTSIIPFEKNLSGEKGLPFYSHLIP